jgi:hypothetical protein
MTKLRARAKLACELAELNPNRFNEAVHAGQYPCAPVTRPGSARTFDANDIVALCVYSQLMREGVSAGVAGHRACKLRSLLEEHPEASRAFHVQTTLHDSWHIKRLDPEHNMAGGCPILSSREWFLSHFRDRAVQRLEELAMIVGDE